MTCQRYQPARSRLSRIKPILLLRLIALFLVVLAATGSVSAQAIEARITVLSHSPARVKVEGSSAQPMNDWSFLNVYANVVGLGDRIGNLELWDSDGIEVDVRRLAAGEFRASTEAKRFRYEINLGEPRTSQMVHASWLNQRGGILMLADLLPTTKDSPVLLSFNLPPGWKLASSITPGHDSTFTVNEPEKAVFKVGSSVKETKRRSRSNELSFVTSDNWPFSHSDALKVTERLVREYSSMTGAPLPRPPMIMLAPLPGSVGPDQWKAETRGDNVLILLGQRGRGKAVLTRLSLILAHELLHLWVPNGLKLEGDYDWFFEGFTVYQALRTALRMDLIRFSDYLDTIARVYDAYLSVPSRDKLSLIEASQRRWTASPSLVYHKGMLVGLLCDLSLRLNSTNRRSIDDIYVELFQMPDARGRSDANAVILSILAGRAEIKDVVERFILRPGSIDLEVLLSPFGLTVKTDGYRSIVEVAPNLTPEQRNLMRVLGYKS